MYQKMQKRLGILFTIITNNTRPSHRTIQFSNVSKISFILNITKNRDDRFWRQSFQNAAKHVSKLAVSRRWFSTSKPEAS